MTQNNKFYFVLVFGFLFNQISEYYCERISKESPVQQRIFNGNDASDGQFPYQVSLRVGNQHICGGSIIASQWILTAGHCIIDAPSSMWRVVVGSVLLDQGESSYEVSEFMRHENYETEPLRNDIALIKLKYDIMFSPNVQKIELGTDEVDEVDSVILGWGKTTLSAIEQPNHLKYLQVRTLSNSYCLYGAVGPGQICTWSPIGEGACWGDFGGPLVTDDIQIGLISYDVFTCGSGLPTVHTRISYYIEWIRATIVLS